MLPMTRAFLRRLGNFQKLRLDRLLAFMANAFGATASGNTATGLACRENKTHAAIEFPGDGNIAQLGDDDLCSRF
jgi:hypothetical protein